MLSPQHIVSRRRFLLQTSALSAAAMFPSGLRAQSVERRPGSVSGSSLLKFNPNGTARTFAGNTIICHLPVQSAVRDAITALHGDLAQSSFRSKLGLTPPDSYHMTVFSGPADQKRSPAAWPSYVPLDAPIERCNQSVAERMRRVRLHAELPFRMTFDKEATMSYPEACSLRLQPVDEEEKQKLRTVRQEIGEAYGFRAPDFETYAFHITVSYQLKEFEKAEQAQYADMLRMHLSRIAAAAPILELGNPEYCVFQDMFRFDVVKMLACS